MISKLVKGVIAQKEAQRRADLYRNLIRHEARIGGELFGPVAQGGRREFFCLDERTWVWHEEWVDENGQHQAATTRYDIRPNGIIKSQGGQYRSLTRQEAINLQNAMEQYQQRVRSELYAFVV
ncbi:MAG TPA: hypothetical protein VK694_03310 [Verrucomicrobiae bacterium]|nr:hypothetical protein [Verrucomicrobiae bacterium]